MFFKILFIILTFSLLTSCSLNYSNDYAISSITSTTNESENINISDISIKTLMESSQVCALISSYSNQYELNEYEKDNKIYSTRLVLQSNINNLDNTITIVQPKNSFVELNELNIVFLNKDPSEKNIYLITGGSSCIININNMNLKTTNKELQKDLNKIFNNKLSNYYTWFDNNYNSTTNLTDDDILNTTLPITDDFSNNSFFTTKPSSTETITKNTTTNPNITPDIP